jgi:hypothetical protein
MNSSSCVCFGEYSEITPSNAEDCFFTVTPWRFTSSGNFANATCTRLLTLTVLMSGFVPSSNDAFRE